MEALHKQNALGTDQYKKLFFLTEFAIKNTPDDMNEILKTVDLSKGIENANNLPLDKKLEPEKIQEIKTIESVAIVDEFGIPGA